MVGGSASIYQLIIDADHTFKNVQEAFNTFFPFLKLEFFYRNSGKGRKAERIAPERSVVPFLPGGQPVSILLNPEMTILELEQLLSEQLLLDIQIYRKAGSVWVETILTGHWSLHLQNEEGGHFSNPVYTKKED